MRLDLLLLSCLVSFSVAAIAEDKIYKTTDAQGNVVFSSTPTPDAEQVELQETNSADAVAVRPREPDAARTEHAERPQRQQPRAPEGDEATEGDDTAWRDVIYDDLAGERQRDRVDHGESRPRVHPLPSGPARSGGGGRR